MVSQSVTIYSTVRGKVNQVGRDLFIRTSSGNYPIHGTDLEKFLGNMVEITGLIKAENYASPLIKVDSCTRLLL